MIKVIKDLATAFVPSGKLIEFVDTFLVSWLSFFQNSSEKKKLINQRRPFQSTT